MFPEYRDLITQLKATDRHFLNLFEKHNELDQRIKTWSQVSNRPPPTRPKRKTGAQG